MVELEMNKLKDLGLNRQVLDALPTAVVGGVLDGSIPGGMLPAGFYITALNHIVPAGQQLKILFLRIFTSNANGATFAIGQTNPTAKGQTGIVEAYPVQGSVPPYAAGAAAIRDYPFLEAAGAEVLHGSLKEPIQVLEGSIDFMLVTDNHTGAAYYGLTWWGVERIPEG